jgi:hypothetical protein
MSDPVQRRWSLWPWITLVVAGLFVATVAAVISNAARSPGGVRPVATEPPQTVTETVTKTVTATVTVTVSPSAPATPAAEFGDGSHVVGLNVAPGAYRTAGPSGTNASGCYWARRKGNGSGVVEFGVVSGPGTITVNAGELVESDGCQVWTKS